MTDHIKRNYDAEFANNERKYAYAFDEVLRNFMVRALQPYFVTGSALEIGCFEGSFTSRLLDHFDDITVIEPSERLIKIAKAATNGRATFLSGRIEDVNVDRRFDNIFLIHTLEHFDEPVAALTRIRSLLSERGRLFVVVPNAEAASRQIAVKMGLLSHNAAVTDGERLHGHRTTYALDTLERDARHAGIVIDRHGGIFFKALANSQFDRVIAEGIVSNDYLEGCYQLGFKYPELCASIFLVCRES